MMRDGQIYEIDGNPTGIWLVDLSASTETSAASVKGVQGSLTKPTNVREPSRSPVCWRGNRPRTSCQREKRVTKYVPSYRQKHRFYIDVTYDKPLPQRKAAKGLQLMLDQIELAKYPVGDYSIIKVDIVEVRHEVLR